MRVWDNSRKINNDEIVALVSTYMPIDKFGTRGRVSKAARIITYELLPVCYSTFFVSKTIFICSNVHSRVVKTHVTPWDSFQIGYNL